MSLSRISATVALVALAGCSLLTGAADLTTDPGITSGGTTKRDGAGGPGDDDGAVGVGTTDGGLDATTPQPDATLDAALPTGRLRQITFENGTVTGLHGADTVTGSPACTSTGALRGKFSMITSATGSSATASFSPVAEVFATFVFKLNELPPGTARIARVTLMGSASTLDLTVDHLGALSGSLGGLSVGVGAITASTKNRFGVHIQTTSGTTKVDVFIASDGQPFAVDPAGTVSVATLGDASSFLVGALSDLPVTATFDDLLIDTLAMPAP